MNILVTGGSGFIGSHFVRHWLSEHSGDSVINLDALTYAGQADTLSDVESDPRYRFVKGDICDEALVNGLAREVDLIVHFAAESHVDRSIQSSREFVRSNVEGTRVLLDAAKNASNRPRFHHVSTDEVFGSLKLGEPKFNEATPYDPRSPYSASKAASDHLVRAYHHTHGLAVTISNCSNNYGPYQLTEKFIPLFITNILQGRRVPLYGEGTNIRDWLYVVDHVKGIEAIIAKGTIGETYCLGGGNELSNKDIARRIIEELGADESVIEHVQDRAGHDFRYAIDYGKAERELAWKPEVDFTAGLHETIQWYKDNAWWWEKQKNLG